MLNEHDEGGHFHRLVDITVPLGGAVVAFAEVYVDESGTHETSDMTVVAGYVFRRVNAKRFQTEWMRVLRREGIPYFHMTDCATGNGFFKDWSIDRRLKIEKALIRLVRKESAFGFAMGMRPSVFRKRLPGTVTPYTFLLTHSLLACQWWAHQKDFHGRFAYFFEAGHDSQSQAGSVMQMVAKNEKGKDAAQYLSHTFIGKEQAAALQAADLLAWLSRNALEKREAGKYPRKDFLALKRDQDILQYHDDLMLMGPRFRGDPVVQALTKGYTHLWKESGWGEPNFKVNWPDWPKADNG